MNYSRLQSPCGCSMCDRAHLILSHGQLHKERLDLPLRGYSEDITVSCTQRPTLRAYFLRPYMVQHRDQMVLEIKASH